MCEMIASFIYEKKHLSNSTIDSENNFQHLHRKLLKQSCECKEGIFFHESQSHFLTEIDFNSSI